MKGWIRTVLILGMLTSVEGFAQELPKKGYLHLTGHTGTGQALTMNLVKINDSIYCDYAFGTSGATDSLNLIQMQPHWAGGKVSPDGSFTMLDPLNPDGPRISGQFISRQNMSGSWSMNSTSTPLAFTLTERYPAGTLPLNVYFLKGSRALVKNPKSPRAVLQECLVVPGESGNPVVSDTLKDLILRSFAGKTTLSKDPDSVLSHIRDHYYADYANSNEDLVTQMGLSPTMDWSMERLVHIVCNELQVFTWYVMRYGYTGGAHGLEMLEYHSADLVKGKLLLPEDVFIRVADSALTALLTAKLKQSAGLGPDQKLTGNGFFSDEVAPSDNFFITPEGIGFCYNPYDIAPYATGRIVIFLGYDEISPFLKPGILPSGFIR